MENVKVFLISLVLFMAFLQSYFYCVSGHSFFSKSKLAVTSTSTDNDNNNTANKDRYDATTSTKPTTITTMEELQKIQRQFYRDYLLEYPFKEFINSVSISTIRMHVQNVSTNNISNDDNTFAPAAATLLAAGPTHAKGGMLEGVTTIALGKEESVDDLCFLAGLDRLPPTFLRFPSEYKGVRVFYRIIESASLLPASSQQETSAIYEGLATLTNSYLVPRAQPQHQHKQQQQQSQNSSPTRYGSEQVTSDNGSNNDNNSSGSGNKHQHLYSEQIYVAVALVSVLLTACTALRFQHDKTFVL